MKSDTGHGTGYIHTWPGDQDFLLQIHYVDNFTICHRRLGRYRASGHLQPGFDKERL